MSATIAIARLVVPALPLLPLAAVLLIIVAVNLGWWAIVRIPRSPSVIAAQIALDSVLLTALLALSGGLSNPFAVFIAFQPALAGILSNGRNGRTTLGVCLLSVASIAVLAGAQPLSLASAPLGPAVALLIGRVASLVSLVIFLAVSAVVYAERLADLREAGERNERLAILGRLVGSISHELSTPLGTIVLGTRDLAAMLANGSEETAAIARTVADQAERAGDIIGLLRGHIRPDQHAELVDLSSLVPEIAGRELDRLAFRGERTFVAPCPVHATVLRVGLCQILQNLLANAAHATEKAEPEPSRRRIAVEVISSVTDRGQAAEIRVSDNGRGFSPQVLARLGEPFQTTKADDGGLGLGLYVSIAIALRLGGSLQAENLPGGGARVTLSIDRRVDDSPLASDRRERARAEAT
jgi:two-component system sensor histidine kinase RegB